MRVTWEAPFPSGGVSVRAREGDSENRFHEPHKDVTGYTVLRHDGRTFNVDTQVTMITYLNVQPGEEYSYTITAHGSGDESLPSIPTKIRIPHVPAVPQGLGANVEISPSGDRATVLLNWQSSTVPRYSVCIVAFPITKYRLQRIVGGDAVLPPGDVGPDTITFEDADARRNTTYTYRLVAVNAVGDSPAALLEVSIP